MKVYELIKVLKAMPQKAEVYIDNNEEVNNADGWFLITGCEDQNTEEVLLNWEQCHY